MTELTTEELEDFYKQNVGKALLLGIDSYRISRGLGYEWSKTAIMWEMLKDMRDVWPEEFKMAMEMDERPAI